MDQSLEYAPTVLAMAELLVLDERFEEALTLATESLERTRPIDQLVEVHVLLANIQLGRGDAPAAGRHAAAALELASRLGSPRLLSLAHEASTRAAQPAAAV